ncbi:MAG: DMT family transporter [candidate division NC10 bacterium]|nr:DMT family transporter [candidate division NC10 bacterium]
MGEGYLQSRTAIFVLFLCLLWGGNMVAIKVGLEGVPPLSAAGIRFSVASLCVYLWARWKRVNLHLTRAGSLALLILGLIFTAQLGLMNLGINLTTAARSSVFLYTQPIFVVLLAHFFIPGESLRGGKLFGVLLSMLGLLVAFAERFSSSPFPSLVGDGLVVLSAFLWGMQTIYVKRLVDRLDPFVLVFYQMVVSFPLFFLLSLLFEPTLMESFSWRIFVAFFYQAVIVAGGSFVAWTTLVKCHQVGNLSAFTFITPIFGVLLSHLILGERLTPNLALGLILVAAGIYIVNKPERKGGS